MTRIFMATVQLIILAKDEVAADDAVNNILTEADERLHDWHYLKVGKQRLTPTRDYGYTIEVAEREGLHGSTSMVLHQSKAAELLLHRALSAIEQVRDNIVDDNGSLFRCFITGFRRGNEICQTSDSPVCKLCRDCQ